MVFEGFRLVFYCSKVFKVPGSFFLVPSGFSWFFKVLGWFFEVPGGF